VDGCGDLHCHRRLSRWLTSSRFGRFSRHSLPLRTRFLPTECAGGHLARNLRPDAGHIGTLGNLAEAVCREWPLAGSHSNKLYFRIWPVTDSEPLLTLPRASQLAASGRRNLPIIYNAQIASRRAVTGA
jgi:hypothetical protein